MENELKSILEKGYGVHIYREDISEDDLKNRGYRKTTSSEAIRFDTIFQYAPHVAKDVYYTNAVKSSFDSAVKSSYRVKLEPGLHLGKSKTTLGAFKGNAYDEKGKLKTHADWLVNDAKLNVSNAPQIAMSVFTAISFVTGQYFMAKINKNLSDIQIDTKEIKQFLINDKESTIKATIEELNEIISHLPFIVEEPDRKNQTLQKLSTIQLTARKYIDFSKRTLEDIKQESSEKDKSEIIKVRLKDELYALMQYRLMVNIYSQTKLIEIYLNNILNAKELILYRDELDNIIHSYIDTQNSTIDWVHCYLNENNSLNKAGVRQILLMIGGGLLPIIWDGWRGVESGISSANQINDRMTSKRQDYKNKHIEYAQDLINPILYDYNIKEPIKNLNQFIEVASKEIEVIKIGDSVYTNLLE